LDGGRSVRQMSEGGYIIVGYTCSYGAGGGDVWLIKTDSSGNKAWDRTFGGTEDDRGRSVEQTSDGGYVTAGWTKSYGAGDADVWLIKTDSSGNKMWDETFGHVPADWGSSIRQTTDGGYIIAGARERWAERDVWLLKLKPETADCPWLDESPSSGSVGPGNLDNITVTINTTGLGSDYSAEIVISSNDPNNPELTVPVTLVVTAPPSVTTNDATNITSNSATLNGNLDGLGAASSVDVSFEWGTETGVYPSEITSETMTTTGPFSFNLPSLTPGTPYYFRAKAVGDGISYGLEKSFTTEPASYDILLYSGWNLISLPLIPQSQSIEDVLAGISVDGVAAYDGATQAWYLYSPGVPSDLTEMTHGKGYWVKVTSPCTLTIEGTVPGLPYDRPLFAGWNLIGLPLIPEPQSIEDVLAGISVDGVAAYDGATQTWYLYSPGAPSDLTEMTHGKGYWVKLTDPCTLTIEGS